MILNSNLSSFVSGLQKAQTQVAQSAEKIVSASAEHSAAFEKSLNAQSESVENAVAVQTSLDPVLLPQTDIVSEVVAMNVAAQTYKANIAAVKTWDAMNKAALDTLRTPTDETV